MSTPIITLRMSRNGGAQQTGGVVATLGDVVILSVVGDGIQTARYELRGFPVGFTVPAGWSTAADGTFYVITNGSAAPPFTLTPWGKWAPRVTTNNGQRDDVNVTDQTDDRCLLSVVSPISSLHDVAVGEADQLDPLRKWLGPLSAVIRRSESLSVGADTNAVRLQGEDIHASVGSAVRSDQLIHDGTNWTIGRTHIDVRTYGAVGDGVTNDAVAFQNALNAAGTLGGTVWVPPTTTGYLLAAQIFIPRNTRLLGSFAGMRIGIPKTTESTKGSTLVVPSSYTGKLIELSGSSTVQGIEVFYKDQVTTGTPTVYDWTFHMPGPSISASVLDCSMPNTYRGILCEAEGCRIDNVGGWALSKGVQLGRVADVARVSNCQFNSHAWPAGAGLVAWYDANGRPYLVDGAEEFCFVNCFSYGGKVGLTFRDEDADMVASFGSWTGGGFDSPETGIDIEGTAVLRPLDARGLRLSNVAIIPRVGSVGIKFSDNYGAIAEYERPRIMMSNVSIWQGAGLARGVWFDANSRGSIAWTGGYVADATNEMILISGANARVAMFGVLNMTGVTRINNAGASTSIVDLGAQPTDPARFEGSIDFATINAGLNVEGNIGAAQVTGNEQITVGLTGPLPNGISFVGAWCSSGLVWVALCNTTGGNIVVGPRTFRVRVSR